MNIELPHFVYSKKTLFIIGFFILALGSGIFGLTKFREIKNVVHDSVQSILPEQKIEVPDVVPTIVFENIPDESFVPLAVGKQIRINLAKMELSRYEGGTLLDVYTIISKGKTGSYWETPGGSYTVSDKEEDYYSEKVGAYLPYSLHLFGNYIIHGIPHDKRGNDYGTSFSNGGIRLRNTDAEELFLWTDADTPVSLFSDSTLKPETLSTKSVYISEDGKTRPNVSAESYLVADIDTGEIIISKNEDAIFPIASVSKLMTTLVSIENINQFDMATVSKEAVSVYGASGLRPGEKIQLSNLIYPLLLVSSNDAAEVIAEHLGHTTFLTLMNAEAQKIGMGSTFYEDPSGLSPNNVSTVNDLFKLTQYVYKEKPFIYDISKRVSYSAQGHSWRNINQFLNIPGYIGGKAGRTEEAKQSNIGLFSLPLSETKNRNIAIIVLRSEDKKSDTLKILSYLKSKVVFGREGTFTIADDKTSAHEITLSFAGDIMLDRGVKYSVRKNFDGDYSHLFDNLEMLKESDLFFANLEGPVSDKGRDMQNLYSFRMEPQVIDVLKGAGVDVVSFANNHIGDWSRAAFDDTRARLSEVGIVYTGSGNNVANASEPKIIEKNGVKIGFLGFTDVGPQWLEASEQTSGVLLASNPHFDDIIREASKKVDILVTSFHWGVEYVEHNDRQTELAHKAIEAGAKLVIGHHPHVIEATETYKGGLIAYSLGNFIFDQAFSEKTMQGMIFQVTVDTEKKALKRYDKFLVKLGSTFQPQTPVPYK